MMGKSVHREGLWLEYMERDYDGKECPWRGFIMGKGVTIYINYKCILFYQMIFSKPISWLWWERVSMERVYDEKKYFVSKSIKFLVFFLYSLNEAW